MRIGFTGTRRGMTDAQRSSFQKHLLLGLPRTPTELRHGSCEGADVQAARFARSVFDEWRKRFGSTSMIRIIALPGPDDDPHREVSGVDDEVLPGKTHFARNRDIVNASDLVIGCPGEATWQKRGGTFFTMDYAIKKGKPLVIIWPDGTVEWR
jgi:hypothetical protein